MEEVDAIFAGLGEIHQRYDVWNAFRSPPGFVSLFRRKDNESKKNKPQGTLK